MRILTATLLLVLNATRIMADVPRVVTDIAPVQSLAAAVMGDLGAPKLLLNAGSDPHHFQLRPSQARALAEAELLFWVGAELTPWLEPALETLAASAEAVALLQLPGSRDAGHSDPHAWLDPDVALIWLDQIASRLAASDPANAATYRDNAAQMRDRVQRARADAAALLAPIRADLPAILTAHDAYGYFGRAFDIDFAGALSDSDGSPPSAARLRQLQVLLAPGTPACILSEPQQDPARIRALFHGRTVLVQGIDPMGANLKAGAGQYPALIGVVAAAIARCAGPA